MRQLFVIATRKMEKKVSSFNRANLKKTINYFKRNGIKNTLYTVLERCAQKGESYSYIPPKENTLNEQRSYPFEEPCKFSILVPAYETKETYLRELTDSCLRQRYSDFELIIADASESACVEQVMKTYADERIVYKRLTENKGISGNTNEALKIATGDYVGLLDHDDLLTEDALYEMARAIERGKKDGIEIPMLYSDEDKCDGEGKVFFDPHKKTDFNLDLLLSNNYICHFTVMKRELMEQLKFREDYDGAQDYDIILRGVAALLKKEGYVKTKEQLICHIPKILYHWRCHEASTAINPESKRYAYEAGKMAVTAFLDSMGWKAKVEHSCHLGFYEVEAEDVFDGFGKVGAVGGKVIDRQNKIAGNLWQEGKKPLEGVHVHFSGYMNRASLKQTMDILDLRCIRINPELRELFEEITGMKYTETNVFFAGEEYKKSEAEWSALSKAFCGEVQKRGYRLIFYPQYVYKIRKK